MESEVEIKEQPFVTAFVSSSLSPSLEFAEYSHHANHYFLTEIRIGPSNARYSQEVIVLDDKYSLFLFRNNGEEPIQDLCNFEHVPDGWERVKFAEGNPNAFETTLCVQKGVREVNTKCVYSIEIIDELIEDKMEEVTQPSLTDKSQLFHSYLKIEIGESRKYVNINKRSELDAGGLSFLPVTESLYERMKNELDITSMAILCFPEGVRVLKKESGFKFFTFILTTDSAERYYCNSIIFSERLSHNITDRLGERYGIKNERGMFSPKVFTLISEYNCTDQTNKCLEYLYRVYLSKPYNVFEEKINNLPNSFRIDIETNKSKFEVEDFGLCFKINSSYPQTSTQAIYAIFKFMEIDNIVTVVENLLLERKIFFVSDCENIIGMAIEAFLSFIYPMNWIHGIINPLSSSMIEYTEAPMTITFGLSNDLVNKIRPNVDGLFVYLDQNRVELKNNQEIKMMPNLRRQLVNRLMTFNVYDYIDVRDYLNNPENLSLFKTQKTEDPDFDAYKIRNIFFELTVFMLRNYKDYFIKKTKNETMEYLSKGKNQFYDFNGILHLYKKDLFMYTFLNTSLFSVLLEKKREEPDNKWIKTLDRAIRKISSFKKHYIQEESDNCSDTNEPELINELIPRGCLGLINFSSKSSEETLPSSPNSKKSISQEDRKEILSDESPTRNIGRMSLPNEYERRSQRNISFEETSGIKKEASNLSDKQEKETERGSDICGKSDQDIPEMVENEVIVVYEFDADGDNKEEGVSTFLCNFFSYPYKKMSNSVVTRWTKKKFNSIRLWKQKKGENKLEEEQINDTNKKENSEKEQEKKE